MKVTYKDFVFDGTVEELKAVYPFLTGNIVPVSVQTVHPAAPVQTVEQKKRTRYTGPVVMQIKKTGSLTMMFDGMQEAARFLHKPDASTISNSIRLNNWTKSNRAGDDNKYRFWTLKDAREKFGSQSKHLFDKSLQLSKKNPSVNL